MKRICAAVLGHLAASGCAFAADLPALVSKAPVAAPAPAYGWSGLYVGGHLGGAWANNDWFFPNDPINSVAQRPVGIPAVSPPVRNATAAVQKDYLGPTVGPFNVPSGSNSPSGWLAGAQIGYNYQIQNWVLGVEGEASWTNLKGSNLDPIHPDINHTDTDFVGVLGGRLGYSWDDRLMVYGKAGGAWVNNTYSVFSNTTFTVSNSPFPVTVTPGMMVDQATVNRFGYMLGAGVEYALTPQWSVRAEYEYLDFGPHHAHAHHHHRFPIRRGYQAAPPDRRDRLELQARSGPGSGFGGGPSRARSGRESARRQAAHLRRLGVPAVVGQGRAALGTARDHRPG